MIEFITVATILFVIISASFAVLGGAAILLSIFFDMVQDKFGDDVAFWVSAIFFVAIVSTLISGLMLIGDGSGAQ